jgi:hypothetical protein
MKFLINSSILLSTMTPFISAENEPTPTIEPRKFKSIISMAYSQINTKLTKSAFESKITNYGCHCFPNGSKSAGGAGPAVDLLDSKCKNLASCHKCIEIEFGKDAVDVDDGRYTWNLDKNNNEIICPANKNNHNPARQALCECDKHFALEIASIWNEDSVTGELPTSTFNKFFWDTKSNRKAGNPVFDYSSTCKSDNPQGSGNQANMCCGLTFPNKAPYNSDQRGCCNGGDLYNVFTQECCSNGRGVKAFGTC